MSLGGILEGALKGAVGGLAGGPWGAVAGAGLGAIEGSKSKGGSQASVGNTPFEDILKGLKKVADNAPCDAQNVFDQVNKDILQEVPAPMRGVVEKALKEAEEKYLNKGYQGDNACQGASA